MPFTSWVNRSAVASIIQAAKKMLLFLTFFNPAITSSSWSFFSLSKLGFKISYLPILSVDIALSSAKCEFNVTVCGLVS